jgi:lipopolysaccharide transport system permease protein
MNASSTAVHPSAFPSAGTVSADARPSLRADAAQIVRDYGDYRFLLWQLTLRDVRIRYKQAVMGFFWALFMPSMIVVSGVLVKLAMARFAGTELQLEQVAALGVKSLAWAFFVGSIQFSVASLTGNMSLVTKIYFPREVLPISSTLGQAADTGIAAAAFTVALPFLGVAPSGALLWVPVLLALLFVLTAALALFLSCANLFFRDVKYIVQVLVTFGIFFAPVFYEPQALGGRLGGALLMSPVAPLLEGLRLVVVQGHDLRRPLVAADGFVVWHPWMLAYVAALAVLSFVAASLLFHRLEIIFAERA